MTIKTLEYIHQLLMEKEAETGKIYKNVLKLQHENEELEEGKKMDSLKEFVVECMKIHAKAASALEEFESQEW